MAEPKTKPTKESVSQFLANISEPGTRSDAKRIAAIMRRVTGKPGEMWGTGYVGFGRFQYKKDGTEWAQVGFAPRKESITLYLASGLDGLEKYLEKLDNPDCGKSCIYIPALAELSEPALEKLLRASVRKTRAMKPAGTERRRPAPRREPAPRRQRPQPRRVTGDV
jgi:hypothetical protein